MALNGDDTNCARRNADDRRHWTNRFKHDRARTNSCISADLDITQHGRTRSDQDAASDLRMSITGFGSAAAECHILKKRYIVFDDRRFANDNSGCVVEENSCSEFDRRMNVDLENFGGAGIQIASKVASAVMPKRVGKTMDLDGMKPLKIEEYVERFTRSGVSLEYGGDIQTDP